MGHKVRLIVPKFVTPYRLSGKRGKNDAADAAAICEAVQRPHLRFVPIKSVEQQARLAVHRMRQQQFGGKTCVSPTHSHVAKQDLAPDVCKTWPRMCAGLCVTWLEEPDQFQLALHCCSLAGNTVHQEALGPQQQALGARPVSLLLPVS